jgi:predicted RNA-binding Zn-ribbon protein involved in translation (DUF1610 family)
MPYPRPKPPPGGIKANYPGFLEPALATSIDKVPVGERWVHEIKWLPTSTGAVRTVRMTSGIRTTVVFSCPKCGRIYQATQEHVAEKRAGGVDCQDCGTVIHTWYGFFRYADWKAIA